MTLRLSGRRVVLTGGASGLGRAMLNQLVAEGAHVVVFDRDADQLSTLTADFPDVAIQNVELTDANAVESAVEQAFAILGGVDVLINNAGIICSAPLIDVLQRSSRAERMAQWETVISTNLTAVYSITMSIAERMVRKRIKGTIINISSISARGNAGQSAYAAAKAGVEALTVSWARELGPLGIRAVCIAPGFVDTPSTHNALTVDKIADIVSRTPLRRLAKDHEVALAVVQMIENSFVTGAVLSIDGGLVL
ncbi:SDR family NAD(P)-dependent oxidoreductase (plasmid) [Azospirillum sp. A23]|uniref:SDR family NAD(P)-dependent oxidoreductase n=1 Tax=Azospirillum sp. TSA6c TaxID=709813 RepID=UPI0011B746E1|nr:SDR family NAD(P)-dependent oxidoreductase [Azospirillum sp. TSA6c]